MSSHSFSGAPAILVALLAVASTANAAPSATRVRAVFPMENDAWHRGPPGFPVGAIFRRKVTSAKQESQSSTNGCPERIVPAGGRVRWYGESAGC